MSNQFLGTDWTQQYSAQPQLQPQGFNYGGSNSGYLPQAQPQGLKYGGFTATGQMGMGPQSPWGQPLIDNSGLDIDMNAAINNAAVAQPDRGFWGSMLGKTDENGAQQGWGGLALGAASGLANTYMGLKQYKLAKDDIKQNKREFDLNFGVQRGLTNTAMRDRQTARVAAAPNSTQSVESYMAQNGIK